MAALAVDLHTSLLLITMDGAEAVGGVLSVTTVLESAANKLAGIKEIRATAKNILKNLTTSSPKNEAVQGQYGETSGSNQNP